MKSSISLMNKYNKVINKFKPLDQCCTFIGRSPAPERSFFSESISIIFE